MTTREKTEDINRAPQSSTTINIQRPYLVVHGIQAMGGYDVPGMDQPVQRTRALGEMGVVGIVRTDPIQNEIEAIGKVGHTRPETVQVEPILDVRSLDLAEHLVSLEAAEPLDPGLVVAGRRGILVVGHIVLFIETTNAAKLSSATRR